jgi:hypothetical protein
MGMKQALTWATIAVVASIAGRQAYKELFPTPSSYAAKILFSNQNVDMAPNAVVSFAFDVKNDGRKHLANVPVQVSCFVNVNGAVPEEQTMDTGPLGPDESIHLDGRAGPFPTTLYTTGACNYRVTSVVFTE